MSNDFLAGRKRRLIVLIDAAVRRAEKKGRMNSVSYTTLPYEDPDGSGVLRAPKTSRIDERSISGFEFHWNATAAFW